MAFAPITFSDYFVHLHNRVPRPEAAGPPHKAIVYPSETLETVKHLKHLLSQKRHYPLRQPLVGTVIAHTDDGLVAIDANGEGD